MKKLVNYQLNQCKKAVIIYYSIIILISAITYILAAIYNEQGGVAFSNSSIIVCFVLGIVLFKQFFNFFQQNGVSRNSQIKSYVLFTIMFALILSTCDTVLMQVFSLIGGGMGSNLLDIYYEYYNGNDAYLSKMIFVFVWQFINYSMMLSIGHFIALLYYRMSRLYRIIVSISVPLIGITLISYFARTEVLWEMITSILEFIYGKNYYINGTLPMIAIFTGIYFINKLLIKGAEVR